MDLLPFKRLLVRTPLQRPAEALRNLAALPGRLRHPELREIHGEPARIHEAMRRLIKPDSNCIDVGAHLGASLAEILRMAPRGAHHAFEASPRKAAWLCETFPEVRVHAVAASDETKTVTFAENLTRSGFSGLRKPAEGTFDPRDRWRTIEVQAVRLDDAIPADARIDFIKIDVEGAEEAVLRGGAELIRRCRPAILFESTPGGAERVGRSRRALFDAVTGLAGYQVFLLADYLAGGPPLDWARFDGSHVYPFKACNYLAVPAVNAPARPPAASGGLASVAATS